VEVLEIQIIENLQREGLHPLEEAHGYHALIAAKCDVQKIASRVGRSVGYVYDRVKLLSLTKAAQKAFLAGAFEAGHAIILARLSPEDQAEAIEHGLFTSQRDLALTPEDVDAENAAVEAGEKSGREYRGDQKAVSVRELQGWVDRHTKVEAHQVDPMLFPETAMTLHDATLQDAKVVRITHEQLTPEELQGDDEGKVILGRSWRRADGFHGSKPCPRSVIGMVVIGPGRGQAFSVCISKKTCEVHWGAEIRARKKTEKAVAKSGKTGEDREALRRNKEQEDEARRKAEDARWKKAIPQIVDEVALVIAKAPAGAKTPLGAVLLGPRGEAPAAHKLVPLGTTAEQLVRALAFGQLAEDLQSCAWGEWERKNAAPHLKLLGLDLFKLLDQVAPLPAPEKPAAAAKAQGPLKRKAKKR